MPAGNHGVGSPLIIVADEASTLTTAFEFSLLSICSRSTEPEPEGNRGVRRLLCLEDPAVNDSAGLLSDFLTPRNTATQSREALLCSVLITNSHVAPYVNPHDADSSPKAPRRTPYRQQDSLIGVRMVRNPCSTTQMPRHLIATCESHLLHT